MARVNFGKRLLLVGTLCISASAELWASTDTPPPAKTSFAYPTSHTAAPLPVSVIDSVADQTDDPQMADDSNDAPPTIGSSTQRMLSRGDLCSTAASVARANHLPIPFFTNLILQESNFDTKTVSRAGAQGIAQFMPKTAVEHGLTNPFEPIHALNVAAKLLRELNDQFGNLGLAAAAYNAGPRRVIAYAAKRGSLPTETRRYVQKVTGRPIEQWRDPDFQNSPEAALMPAKAECPEVVEAAAAQAKVVRVTKLMDELAAAASIPETEKEPPAAAEKHSLHKTGKAHSAKRQAKDAKESSAARRKHDARKPAKAAPKSTKAKPDRQKVPNPRIARAAVTPLPPTPAKAGGKAGAKVAARASTKIGEKKTAAKNAAPSKAALSKAAQGKTKTSKVAANKAGEKIAEKRPIKRETKRKSRPESHTQFASSFFGLFDFK